MIINCRSEQIQQIDWIRMVPCALETVVTILRRKGPRNAATQGSVGVPRGPARRTGERCSRTVSVTRTTDLQNGLG